MNKDRTNLLYYIVTIIIALIYLFFPKRTSFDYVDILMQGLLFLAVIFVFLVIKKLNIKVLNLAWWLVTWGLQINFIDEFVITNDTVGEIIEGVFPLLGFLIMARGLYKSIKSNQDYLNRYKSLFYDNHSIILLHDPKTGQIIDINKGAQKFYNYDREELLNKKITDILASSEENIQEIMGQVKEEKMKKFYSKHKLSNGQIKDIEVYSGPIKIEDQTLIYSIIHDISERKKAEERLEYLSFHDQLTGLKNRRYFEKELKFLNKNDKVPVSLLMIDIDKLKNINDTYGHEIGDKFIKRTADILLLSVRDDDIVARIGGDEFVIILKGGNEKTAQQLVSRINKKCQNYHFKNIQLSLSIGYASKNNINTNLYDIFKKADEKMYQVKKRNFLT